MRAMFTRVDKMGLVDGPTVKPLQFMRSHEMSSWSCWCLPTWDTTHNALCHYEPGTTGDLCRGMLCTLV